MNPVFTTDSSYSPDVEIDERGRVIYTRDIKPGETIRIPAHMAMRIFRAASQERGR